jgi:hypothetical protein
MSTDKKVFVQWYHNDSTYHQGQNEVVDQSKMEEKWLREVNYLTQMRNAYPELVPTILNIKLDERKLYLKVDGPDFWEQAGCDSANFDKILPDWQEQMLNIISVHKSLGFYKYSMHPSSYFIVDGRLKSINYFFCYGSHEGPISIATHSSHIHSTRQAEMRKHIESLSISWDELQPLTLLEQLCWDSFSNTYPADFIQQAKELCMKS